MLIVSQEYCSSPATFPHIPDRPVELAGPLEGVPLLPHRRLVLPEVADVPDEAGLDVLVVEELREDDELLAQELKWGDNVSRLGSGNVHFGASCQS